MVLEEILKDGDSHRLHEVCRHRTGLPKLNHKNQKKSNKMKVNEGGDI